MNRSLRNAPAYLSALALLLASTLACGGVSTAPVAANETNAPSDSDVPAETATQAISSGSVGSSPQNPTPRTEIVSTADWEFKVVEVVRGSDAMDLLKEASPFNKEHPDPAMEYVLVKIHAKYVGTDTDTHHIDSTFFKSMSSANILYDKVSILDATSPAPSVSSFDDLTSGGEVEGWTVVQVAKDETGIMLVILPRDNGLQLGEETIRYISLE